MRYCPATRSIAAGVIVLLAACTSDEDENAAGGAGGTAAGGEAGSADAQPSGPTGPNEWSRLGYDLASTYHNTAETTLSVDSVASLEQKWEFSAGRAVTGAAAVVGDRVYVLADALYALDAASGDEIWQAPDISGGSSPCFHDGAIYVHGSGSVLARFEAETGNELWRTEVSTHAAASGTSSPVVVDRYVIVGSSSGEEGVAGENATFRGSVVAFDKEVGTEIWRHWVAEEPYNGSAVWSTVSVNLQEQVIYATSGNNYTDLAGPRSDSIFALELATGELLWNFQATEGDVFTIVNPNGNPDDDFGANPFFFDWEIDGVVRKLVVAGQKSGTVWALDRETGLEIWSRNLSGSNALLGGMLNNGAFDGEHVLVSANTATSDAPGSEPPNGETVSDFTSVLTALDPATGNIVWERQLPAAVWAPITTANGVGFVGYEKHLQAFDVSDGTKLFVFDVEGTIASAPAVTGGRVWFGSGMTYFAGHPGTKFHVLGLP